MANSPPALGASAAVNGIVMLSILLYPRRMVYLYAVLPVPAALLGVLYIGSDMLGVLGVRNLVQTQHSCYISREWRICRQCCQYQQHYCCESCSLAITCWECQRWQWLAVSSLGSLLLAYPQWLFH